MGQKVNPTGLRLGVNKNWESRWFTEERKVPEMLKTDMKIRKYIDKKLTDASIGRVEIERTKSKTEVIIHTSKPGLVIGKGGESMKALTKDIEKLVSGYVQISIVDVKKPDIDAVIVAKNIAKQIENRVSYRIAQKRAIRNAMNAGAKGIKTLAAGRLNGVEMARSEGYSKGTIPLHTIRADIDYAEAVANTTFGKIGIKVWIYKGEILDDELDNNRGEKEDKNSTFKRGYVKEDNRDNSKDNVKGDAENVTTSKN